MKGSTLKNNQHDSVFPCPYLLPRAVESESEWEGILGGVGRNF
jgi:hypothetical protein